MGTISNHKRIIPIAIFLLIVFVLLTFFIIGMPLVKPILNTLHCQNMDKIAVWSIRRDNPGITVEVVCADGSGVVHQPLSPVIKDADLVVFSPDGGRIALIPSILQDDIMPYMSQDNRDHIWIMKSDSSGLMRLSNIHRHENFPAWSPDGQRLAFDASMTDESHSGIYVTDLACLDTSQDCVSATTMLVSKGCCPAWSPDGKRIAFLATDPSDNMLFNWEVNIIDIDGSYRANLTHNSADDFSPAWSSDGQLIIFYSSRNPSGIYMMNADGSNPTFVTEGDRPKWSPDDQFIAFTSTRDNGGRVISLFPDSSVPADALYLMTRDGSKIIKLTHHDYESITDYFWLP